MWQRFTEDARRVVLLAQEEAANAQSAQVDTEHLLLGCLLANEQRMEELLLKAGINAKAVRTEAAHFVAQHPRGEKDQAQKLTPTAKRVLELATDEARRARSGPIEAEHLLLGLVRDTQGLASQILRAQGAELERYRVLVKEQLVPSAHLLTVPFDARRETGVEFDQEVADVLLRAIHWAKASHGYVRSEHLLLALLERREELLVEITGLDVLALKKARLKLLIGVDFYEEAFHLRNEIESEQI